MFRGLSDPGLQCLWITTLNFVNCNPADLKYCLTLADKTAVFSKAQVHLCVPVPFEDADAIPASEILLPGQQE